MASGIPVSTDIVQAYQDVNQRKNWAVIIKLENNLMAVDKTFSDGSNDPEADWNEVLRLLKEGGSRYVICDFKSKETELVTKSKLCLIAYVSEESKVFEKM